MVTTNPSAEPKATASGSSPQREDQSTAKKLPRSKLGLTTRIHYLAGFFVAPLIIVAAISGFFYALAPTIEQFVYHDEMTATSQEAAHPVDEQVEAAKKLYPTLKN